jgi:glutamate synthase (NADPH/NADH)
MGTALNPHAGLVSTQDARHVSLGALPPARRAAAKASGSAKPAAGPSPRVLRWQQLSAPGRGSRLIATQAHTAIPAAEGLFNPANDKDACGVGFMGELSKRASRKCVTDALKMLARMTHR